jgi:hypothetical protein
MRFTPPKSCLYGALILISAHAVGASTTPGDGMLTPPSTLNVPLKNSLDTAVFESLRRDVAIHPNDFLTFETQTTANHFIFEHVDAFRETDRRVIQRGILGYWRGKTLVVLPSLSIGNHL